MDCEKAIDRIQERRPDAIVLDVMFPENDTAGFELARAIRRMFGELPILLLTAVNQSFPLGFSSTDLDPTWLPAVAFLEKPVDFALLCEKSRGDPRRHFAQAGHALRGESIVFVWLFHRISGALLIGLLSFQLFTGFFQASSSNLETVKTIAALHRHVRVELPAGLLRDLPRALRGRGRSCWISA